MSRAWLVAAVVVAAGCASDETASTSQPPPLATPVTTAPTASNGVTPEGFEAVAAEITAADGDVCAVCLWQAATPEQRAGRGLMGVTDMGAADGMVFLFDEISTSAFWMRDTPMPLSIAFFDAAGSFVSSTDMEPCIGGAPAECTRYHADGPYASAIEVPQGELDELLIAAGSRLDLLDAPCEQTP